MKKGTVLIVKDLSVIEADGGNTSDMIAGEEVPVTSVGDYFIDTDNGRYGSFTITKGKDGLNWETFFTVKGENQ